MAWFLVGLVRAAESPSPSSPPGSPQPSEGPGPGEPAVLDPGVVPLADRSAQIVERGGDYRVIEWYSQSTDDTGASLILTNRYTEVATGLHFLDAQGEWQDTVAAFDPVPNGWVAARGPHQVALSADLSVPGSVTVVTTDGHTLRSTPTLLAYVDRSSGQEVRLAELQPSSGELIGPGTVLYANAFDTVPADVRAVYTPAGFECDVILRAPLPAPAELGLNPETTEVAVFTEYFETEPTGQQEVEMPVPTGEGTTHTLLEFGAMRMDRGKAFLLPGTVGQEIPVRQTWEIRDGRRFLVERTDWTQLEPLLREIPGASVPARALRRTERTARLELPARRGPVMDWPRTGNGRLLAEASATRERPMAYQASASRPGVVLDYTLVNSSTNYTFNSLMTYYVTGQVNLSTTSGANDWLTFQPGTVIKFAKTNSPSLRVLAGARVNWQGAPYRPVVLTAYDDNSVGEWLPSSSGSPSGIYAAKALDLDGTGRTQSLRLTNLFVRHAGVGVAATSFSAGTAPLVIRHAQFLHCDAVGQFQQAPGQETYFVQNALVYSTNAGSHFIKNTLAAKVSGEFLTVNDVDVLFHRSDGLSTLGLTNCLFYQLGNTNGFGGTNCLAPPAVLGNPFIASGAGSHYLRLSSPALFNWFMDNWAVAHPISPDLGNEIADFTTVDPPSIMSWPVSGNAVVTRSAKVDLDSTLVYIGYHYYLVDHLVSGSTVANATLSLTNGVVLAGTGANVFTMGSGGKLISLGTPARLNRILWASSVQEGIVSPPSSRTLIGLATGVSTYPEVQCRFTQFSMMADPIGRRHVVNLDYAANKYLGLFSLRDCQVHNSILNFSPVSSVYPQTFDLFNNLFVSSTVGAYRNVVSEDQVQLRHNLFVGGACTLYYYHWASSGNPQWVCTDNVFQSTTLNAFSIATNRLYAGWNGYSASSAVLGGTGNKLNLLQDWVTNGPFGPWYYPASGGLNSLAGLINNGSRLASQIGLYHYTTQLDQQKQATTQADIGFHYVATTGSSSRSVVNVDGDGSPDYAEDANGDGDPAGEPDWQALNIDGASDGDKVGNFDEARFGSSPTNDNTDGDALDDSLELQQGTDPADEYQGTPTLLSEWQFNVAGFLTNHLGIAPINGANATLTASYENWAPVFGATVVSNDRLRYPIVSGSVTNITLRWGTAHLTYVADWFFGSPADQPGQWCRLLECGTWRLSVSPNGRYLVFETPAPDGSINQNFTAELPRSTIPISHRTGWEIQLEWNTGYSCMWINGALVTDMASGTIYGSGVKALPSSGSQTNGLSIGSAFNGSLGAKGYIDQLSTFNCVMGYHMYSQNPTNRSLNNTETLFSRYASPKPRKTYEISAMAATAPDGVQLRWRRGWEGDPAANTGKYNLERRGVGQSTWSVVASNLFTGSWRDTGAVAGTYYEYRIPTGSPHAEWPYVTAARQGALVEARGKAMLIVDETLAADLASVIDSFKLDLVADGWQVVSTNMPRHANFQADGTPPNVSQYITDRERIKSFISSQWSTNQSGTNVVILLGHVTIPYSGVAHEDGHAEHQGAWVADSYYGDMDGTWTDTGAYTNGFHSNKLSDGKFDQNAPPGNGKLEVAVGRIDFEELPSFKNRAWLGNLTTEAVVERALMTNYFARNAAFRRGQLGTFSDAITTFTTDFQFWILSDSHARLRLAQTGTVPGYGEFGYDIFTRPGLPQYWGLHGGYGQYYQITGSDPLPRVTEDLAKGLFTPDASFVILRGSNFPNWGYPFAESFVKSCLGSPGSALAVFWAGGGGGAGMATGPWRSGRMFLGGSLGDMLLDTFNGPVPQSARTTFIFGDPTLRMFQTTPVTGLSASRSGSTVELLWSACSSPGATYHVYRSPTALPNSWTRLTTNPTSQFNFINTSVPSGTHHYLVRSVVLRTSGGGSYYDLSHGTRTSIVVP